MSVTKLELSNRIARKLGYKHPEEIEDIKEIVNTFLGEVLQALAEGDRIEIRGFGAFNTKFRKKRIGRNPRTGDLYDIPECTSPTFKFSKDAKKNISGRTKGKEKNLGVL